jgi:hypothetical protein
MNVTMADFWGGAFSGVKSECHGGAHYSYVHELVRMTLPNLKPYNLVSRTCRVVAASLQRRWKTLEPKKLNLRRIFFDLKLNFWRHTCDAAWNLSWDDKKNLRFPQVSRLTHSPKRIRILRMINAEKPSKWDVTDRWTTSKLIVLQTFLMSPLYAVDIWARNIFHNRKVARTLSSWRRNLVLSTGLPPILLGCYLPGKRRNVRFLRPLRLPWHCRGQVILRGCKTWCKTTKNILHAILRSAKSFFGSVAMTTVKSFRKIYSFALVSRDS